MLVGLEVTDDNAYSNYRQEMTPLLEKFGGGFNYDFKVAELLKSQYSENINRVFTIYFPDETVMNEFFDDDQYKKIKDTHFEGAVKSTTIISSYQT